MLCNTILLWNLLNLKGRLNELVAQLRLQQQMIGNPQDVRYSMEKSMQDDLKQVSCNFCGFTLERLHSRESVILVPISDIVDYQITYRMTTLILH